jgi:hypothetical protein
LEEELQGHKKKIIEREHALQERDVEIQKLETDKDA